MKVRSPGDPLLALGVIVVLAIPLAPLTAAAVDALLALNIVAGTVLLLIAIHAPLRSRIDLVRGRLKALRGPSGLALGAGNEASTP